MSRLEELINQHCPDGVEYRTIASLSKVQRGKRLTKDKLSASSSVTHPFPVFHGGIEPLGYYDNSNRSADTVMVINVGASAGTVAYSDVEFWSSDGCFCISHSVKINDRFLYYVLKNDEFYFQSKVRKAGIPTLDNFIVEDYEIPVPPLPVQEEIVRILDKMTELETELETELDLRKKQYDYYRDKMLSKEYLEQHCPDGVEYKPVSEVIESLKTGLNPRKNFKLNDVGACCYYITGKDVYGNSINVSERTDKITKEAVKLINKRACLHDDVLLFVSTGTGTVGRMTVVDKYTGDWNVSETMYIITTKPKTITTKFLFYVLYSNIAKDQYESKISKGSVPHLKVSDLLNVEIPVPPLPVQEEIVRILDNFSTLTSDISEGLPAEIKMRHQQYEYYRDKLLAFKRLNVTG